MTGHPALSLPLAEAEGLPVGVMLVGRHFDEARLLSVARTAERTLGWRPEPSHVAVRAAVPDP
jgi:amidase